jgi:hypothetical protein
MWNCAALANCVGEALAHVKLNIVWCGQQYGSSHHQHACNGDNYMRQHAQNRDANGVREGFEQCHVGDDDKIASRADRNHIFIQDDARKRLEAARELTLALRTKWKEPRSVAKPGNELFPLSLATKTNRGYLVSVVNQMNGCRREGWSDACAVMMRRLVEIVIIEAFEHKGIEAKIQDGSGGYVQLTALVDTALAETSFRLTKNTKKALPKLRNLGHRSAHGRYFIAHPEDIEKNEDGVRVVVEEFLHLADLL